MALRNINIFLQLVYCIFCLCLQISVYSQDAHRVELEISPNGKMAPGTPVNLTCKFAVLAADYQEVRWSVGDGPLLYLYSDKETVNHLGNVRSGLTLSNDASIMSEQWIEYTTNLCKESAREGLGDYKCTVFNKGYDFSDSKTALKFRGPSRKLYLNGSEICQEGRSYVLPTQAIGVPLPINFTTTEERSAIVNMSVAVSTNQSEDFTSSVVDCSYSGEVTGQFVFQHGTYTIDYTVKLASGGPMPFNCKILASDKESTPVPEPGSSSSTQSFLSGETTVSLVDTTARETYDGIDGAFGCFSDAEDGCEKQLTAPSLPLKGGWF